MMEISKKIDTYFGTWLCYGCSLFVSKKKKINAMDEVHSILAVKLVALGDLMLVLPQLKLIKDTYPYKKLILLTTTRVKMVVEHQSFIDQIIYLDVRPISIIKTVFKLKKMHIDVSVDFEHYYRLTALISFFAGIKERIGFSIPGQGRDKLFTFPIPYDKINHELLVFNSLLTPLKIVKKPELVGLPYTSDQQCKVDGLLRENKVQEFIVIQPGTSKGALGRRWGNDRWVELIKKLNQLFPPISIIVYGGKNEEEIVKEWNHRGIKFINLTNKLNLTEFYYLVSRAQVFVGLDTGTTHIAASAHVNIVALYGLNNPLKWGPYGKNNIEIVCKGADPAEYTYNYLGKISGVTNSKGMQAIQVEDVFERIIRFLN